MNPGINQCFTVLNTLKESVTTIQKSVDSRSSEEAKFYENMADDLGESMNQKNAALLKGCERLADAIGKLSSGDNNMNEIFNTSVFKDFQLTLAAQNKVKELLDKSDETRSLVLSRLNGVSEQFRTIEEHLKYIGEYMDDFTNLEDTQVFMPDVIVPFAKAVHSTTSYLRGEFHSVSADKQLEDLQKKLSEETRQKNGFMKVIQFIFEKHPDVKNDVAKHSTHKKFMSKLVPGRKRGRPVGSISKNKKKKQKQKS